MTLAQEMLSTAEEMRQCLMFHSSWRLTGRDYELAELALREAALRLNAEVTERMT